MPAKAVGSLFYIFGDGTPLVHSLHLVYLFICLIPSQLRTRTGPLLWDSVCFSGARHDPETSLPHEWPLFLCSFEDYSDLMVCRIRSLV